MVVDPANTNILYAARNGIGIYRSTDGGLTWDNNLAHAGVDPIWAPGTTAGGCTIYRGALALAPTNTNTLYAAFQTNSNCVDGSGLMFKTVNARATTPTFTQLSTPRYPTGHVWANSSWCRGQCGYDLAVIVQPSDPDGGGPLVPENIVYTGGVGFFRSTDGGSNWTNLGEPPTTWVHPDLHTFAFDPSGALLVGSDGGIYRHPNPATAQSVDPGWVELNTNLALTQFYSGISLHPDTVQSGSTLILGGTQDNGTQKYTGQPQWNLLWGGDGGYTAFDFNNPDTWYISAQNLAIAKTTNNGPNLASATTNLPRSNNLFISPFIMCPDNSQVLIASDDRGVWRTNTGASSWYDNSPDLATVWWGSPSAFAFTPGTSCNTYFAAGRRSIGTIFRTTSGGGTGAANWTDIGGGLPNRAPTDLAPHPTSSNILYITFSGFCGSTATCAANQGHVWVTNNALASNVTWTDLTGGKGMPNIPVNAIALDSVNPNRVYIGTDLGVYRSLDWGNNWELFNNGLPNVAIMDLVLNSETQVLVAATFGRSVYQLTGGVYVDINWTGCENGTYQCPYNTLSEGLSAVLSGGDLLLKTGTYLDGLPVNISKSITIRNYGGTATIGSP